MKIPYEHNPSLYHDLFGVTPETTSSFRALQQELEWTKFLERSVEAWNESSYLLQAEEVRADLELSQAKIFPRLAMEARLRLQKLLFLPKEWGLWLLFDGGAMVLIRFQGRTVAECRLLPTEFSIPKAGQPMQEESTWKAIQEKFGVPVFGFRLHREDWSDWNKSAKPWAFLRKAVLSKRIQITPFRFRLAAYLTFLGITEF